jgi:stigma-specific protein Stig1
MCRWVDALASLGSRAYSAVSSEREGRERMAAQEHNGGGSPSLNPTRVDHSLDELARGLASGTISRGKALRWIGSALVGAALAVVPGVAWAASCPQGQTRCKNRCVNLKTNERHCGSCFNRCGSNQTCCKGRCVNLQTNERHCGCCYHRCAEGQECVGGVCQGPCQPVGGFCTTNSQCCSYNCDPNTGCVPRNPISVCR